MPLNAKLDDKLEGVSNFEAWKYRVSLILKENDLLNFIKNEVSEPQEAEAKEKYKKEVIRAKRIIADSIKDHLIPLVSSKETPKDVYDALDRM